MRSLGERHRGWPATDEIIEAYTLLTPYVYSIYTLIYNKYRKWPVSKVTVLVQSQRQYVVHGFVNIRAPCWKHVPLLNTPCSVPWAVM